MQPAEIHVITDFRMDLFCSFNGMMSVFEELLELHSTRPVGQCVEIQQRHVLDTDVNYNSCELNRIEMVRYNLGNIVIMGFSNHK